MAAAGTWQCRGRQSWFPYAPDINVTVDNAYKAGHPSVQFAIDGEGYTLDFRSMKQQCDADPTRVRSVRPPRGHRTKSHPAGGKRQRATQQHHTPGVIWQHKGQHRWHDFEAWISDLVEEAYSLRQNTRAFVFRDDLYEIDFASMKQRCVDDPSRVRDVRRCGGGVAMPSPRVARVPAIRDNRPAYWDLSLNGVGCARVPCSRAVVVHFQRLFDQTYVDTWTRDRRLRAGRSSGVPAGYEVQSVSRLQDRARWAAYCQRRDEIGKICQARPDDFANCRRPPKTADVSLEDADLDQKCNEVYLFHGAPEAAVMMIIDNGIDVSKGKDDGLLGGGKVYLAESSTKADEYTGLDEHNHFLLVCRSTLGIYHYTEEATPNKDVINAKLRTPTCHSVWAHRRSTTGLNEFAIANALQVYPEYLVHYIRR